MPRPAQEQQPPTPGVELGALLADRELGLRTLAPGGGGATAPATLSTSATPRPPCTPSTPRRCRTRPRTCSAGNCC